MPPDPQQNATATPIPPLAPSNDAPETFTTKVKRNLTPELDTSRSALGPEGQFSSVSSPQTEGEELYKENFGSTPEQWYGHAKKFISHLEDKVSEKVLTPFREGLDRMGEDLEQAGESGHTKSGVPLTGPTRALVSGAGAALKSVPVGKDVKSTVQALAIPPDLGPEGRTLSKEVRTAETVKPNLEGIEAREISAAPKPGAKAPNLAGIDSVEISPAPGKRAAGISVSEQPKIPSLHQKLFDEAVSALGPETKKTTAKTTLNASGESSASAESLSRMQSEKSKGIKRFAIDSRSNAKRPLIGPDAVDYQPQSFEHVIQEDKEGRQTLLDSGDRARPWRSK